MNKIAPALLLVTMSMLLGGCVNHTVKSTSVPSIANAAEDVPEEQLLDVGIVIFDPGLDEYDEDEQVYPEVRRAEARYMPNLLSEAMQNSGAWGTVRVVPSADQINDVIVEGTILHSDGEELQLLIKATDSRGDIWMN